MTILIVAILIIGYLLIATEHITNINKAAVAMFLGVTGWLLYMFAGHYYVELMYADEYRNFLDGALSTSVSIKNFIVQNIFIVHVVDICQIVLFLLATMSIVDLLNTNGCFDFLIEWMRTRNSRRLLWTTAAITCFLSANLDNLTTAVMMFTIIRQILPESKYRMYFSAVIVLAANAGGAMTVIGDVSTLMLWVRGAVTPSDFSSAVVLPACVALIIPTYLVSRKLPEQMDLVSWRIRYRGDDTTLTRWQRILMLFVGIGGLWFIPTFHSLTQLPPFVGALCLLALILFFIGLSLVVSVVQETGALYHLAIWCDKYIHNIYVISLILGVASAFLDNVVLVLTSISMYDVAQQFDAMSGLDWDYIHSFALNGQYWQLVAYSGGLGGCLLSIGSTAGYAMMKSEGVSIWWYFRHMTFKVLIGWLAGLGVYFILNSFVH